MLERCSAALMEHDSTGKTTMPYYRFHHDNRNIEVYSGNDRITLAGALPLLNAYFIDLNSDGYSELCVTGSYESRIRDMHVEVFELCNRKHYALKNDEIEIYDYMLVSEDNEMQVLCGKTYSNWMKESAEVQIGKLTLDGDKLSMKDTYTTFYFKPE